MQTITDLLPDVLRRHRPTSDWYSLRPEYAHVPHANAWAAFLAGAESLCPGFAIAPAHEPIYRQIVRWCMCDPSGEYNPALGLWLCGNIGTGKSTLLAIVREFCALVRQPWPGNFPYSFLAVNAPSLAGVYQSDGVDGLTPYIDSQALAIDDLGSEIIPSSHYGDQLNVLQYLLTIRYDRRRSSFTHVTTNLSMPQVLDLYGERVGDRITEMFNFITLRGTSYRGKEAARQ